jgi:nicotinate-nucleotide--dimethylbenzimidazole phosphoribosyltransferase
VAGSWWISGIRLASLRSEASIRAMWSLPSIPPLDANAGERARHRHAQLTKPPGSLVRIEDLGCQLAAIQGRVPPRCEQVAIIVFAADHGVAAQGVSAYPSAVTAQMVANFARGGAAISVLARQLAATVTVVDVGVASPLEPGLAIVPARIADGSADLSREPAMSAEHCAQALAVGASQAEIACDGGCDCLVVGEMGIGNTTSAAALLAALSAAPIADCIGRGTGIDSAALQRKHAAVAAACRRHAGADPLALLAGCGGYEIAAMVGAMLAAASRGRVVLVDGFIAGVAALLACRLVPACRERLVFAHLGAEHGHRRLLAELAADPLLALDLRLGEGSGAALAVPLLRAACAVLAEMATFDQAGVSGPTTVEP